MSKRYVIRWKSKVNGSIGRGSRIFNREDAESLINELNEEYPEIEHELAEATESLPEKDEHGTTHAIPGQS